MHLKILRTDLRLFLTKHNLNKKWSKVEKLFVIDIRHPSLHVELLEPHWHGIYSLRIDNKYRALFFISNAEAEIFQITNHYRKS